MVKTLLVNWNLNAKKQLFDRANFKKKATVSAFIQAREGSTRFPRKIYSDIGGTSMVLHIIKAAQRARLIDRVVVVSPQTIDGVKGNADQFVWDGPENDVLGRYAAALEAFPCDYVVRLTSDCPFLDSDLIDFVVAASIGADYGSNVLELTFPDGMDVEVMSAATLRKLNQVVKNQSDREHVTTYIRNNPEAQLEMNLVSVQSLQDQSYIKLSVDYPADLENVREAHKLCRR